jgi:hypothetical protein
MDRRHIMDRRITDRGRIVPIAGRRRRDIVTVIDIHLRHIEGRIAAAVAAAVRKRRTRRTSRKGDWVNAVPSRDGLAE